MYNYTYKLFWDNDDECYYAIVLGIDKWEHIVCAGETPEDALREIMAVIKGLIEICIEDGEEVPIPAFDKVS